MRVEYKNFIPLLPAIREDKAMGLEMPQDQLDPFSGLTNESYSASESSLTSGSGSGRFPIRIPPSRSPVVGAIPIRNQDRRNAIVQPSAPVMIQNEMLDFPHRPRRYSYPMASTRTPTERSERAFESLASDLVQIVHENNIQREQSKKTAITLTVVLVLSVLTTYIVTIWILVNWI